MTGAAEMAVQIDERRAVLLCLELAHLRRRCSPTIDGRVADCPYPLELGQSGQALENPIFSADPSCVG